jgi:transcriptional regulator with XRE-family HTH domain
MDRHELKAARKSLGLSLADAAGQVGVTARAWARYESGERQLQFEIVFRFLLINKLVTASDVIRALGYSWTSDYSRKARKQRNASK